MKFNKNKNLIFLILFVLFFSFLTPIGTAEELKTQAIGPFTLGFEKKDYFEYICTEMDTTELNNVFGGDWASDLGNLFWFTGYNAPGGLGEKCRFFFEDITDIGTQWIFTMDGWDWIVKTGTYGVPVQDDVSYYFPKNATDATFNPSVWIITLPVEECISAMSYPAGYSSSANAIYYDGSDVSSYQIGWIYDTANGVVKNFWIKNNVNTTIFEMWNFELPLSMGESYNWVVTRFNSAQITSVFGINWELDLNAYCWWALDAPIANEEKSMFYVDTIANHPSYDDWYTFDIDGWNWKNKDLLHGAVPDRDNAPYGLPMDPGDLNFTYTMFIIPTPVVRFLDEVGYKVDYTHSENEVYLSTSDEQDYSVVWIFDTKLGVVEKFQIKNSGGTIIFEVNLLEFTFAEGTELIWEVEYLNEARAETVFGTDWESELQGIFGPNCNATGAKRQWKIHDYKLDGTFWYVNRTFWDWTLDDFSKSLNITTNWGLYNNPEDGTWYNWMYIVPVPGYYYLVGRSYAAGYQLIDNVVTYDGTSETDYQIKYTYDLSLGVLSNIKLFNNVSQLVYEIEFESTSAPSDGGIPGYNMVIFIPTIIMLFAFLAVITFKKRKTK